MSRPAVLARADALEPLIVRALAAYYQTGSNPDLVGGSELAELDGRRYVVLRDAYGDVIRVYRVRTDGVLRRMKRPPDELMEALL